MFFRHYVPKSILLLATSEALILFGSVYVGVSGPLTEADPTPHLMLGDVWTKGVLYTLLMLLLMSGIGLYQRGLREGVRGLVFRVGIAFAIGFVMMIGVGEVMPSLALGTETLTSTVLFAALGIGLFRIGLHFYLDTDVLKRRVMILGSGALAAHVDQLRRKSDWRDMVLAGYVPVGDEISRVDPSRLLFPTGHGSNFSLLELAVEHDIDEIVVALDERSAGFPVNEVSRLQDERRAGYQPGDVF